MRTHDFIVRSLSALTILASAGSAFSQNWQTIWGDDFDSGSISADWVYDIGTGSGGWGNNELQYYRSENATVENGQLVITAKHESFGGMSYTSARLKTQGRQSFRYGKVEARIAIPSFTGSWPAFWMLGDSITSVGWPQCGELDIMEHINTAADTSGAAHWWGSNNAQADFGGGIVPGGGVTAYHTYSLVRTPSSIRWYCDGVPLKMSGNVDMVLDINGSPGGTGELHEKFFILLNLAVGGNFPGFSINNSALPAKMYVDWVRVAKDFNVSNTFLVANRNSGMILRPENSGTANNTPLVQWPSYVSDNVKWTLTPVGSSQYALTNVASGRALSVDGASQNNNAICKIYDYFGGSQQRFTLDYRGNGFYSLVFVHSGKAMTVLGASTSSGAAIIQYTNNGSANAQWRFKDL